MNIHQAYRSYASDGLAGVAGQGRDLQLELARILTADAAAMNQQDPGTQAIKRDVAQIYQNAYPEEQRAPDWQRQQADRVIAELTQHPAYLDTKHADHATVAARVSQAYAVRHQGESS